MLKSKSAFSSYSTDDIQETKTFYENVLGLSVEEKDMGLYAELPGGGKLFIYPKDNHQPATYTVLNFEVENIDEAMDQIIGEGITFENYEGLTGDDNIAKTTVCGQSIWTAWFQDNAGNIISIMQTEV